MDARHFDALVKTLSNPGTRRGVLGFLATVPLLGGLVSLLDEGPATAKGRRKRRKKPHHDRSLTAQKKRKKKKHKKKKKKCTPQSKSITCKDTCGDVVNNCKQTVNCGPCACDPPCGACFVCDEATRTCVSDPDQQGDPCGQTGQVCQGDGACACDAGSCSNPTPICVDGSCVACSVGDPCPGGEVCCDGSCFAGTCCDSATCGGNTPLCVNHLCTACGSDTQCQNAGLGDLCCSGTCLSGVCCADGDCAPTGNDCVDNQCFCGGDAPCAGGPELCCGGACIDTETDPDHCGVCGETCSGGTPVCWDGACVCGDVCAGGDCQFSSVQAAINALPAGSTIRICAGAYGKITITKDLTLIGAGAGSNQASNTILNAQGSGRVVVVDSDITATLQGVWITNGAGGIINIGGSLTLTDCHVSGNFTGSSGFGGGIYNDDGTVTLNSGTSVTGNTANSGGGIYNHDGTVTLNSGASVRQNIAFMGRGGGIYNSAGTVTLNSGASVRQNLVSEEGGGIYNSGGSVTLNAGSEVCNNDEPQCSGFSPPGGFCGACP